MKKQITKIEQLAALLLKCKINFLYEGESNFLTIKDSRFVMFFTASYHNGTGELILMQGANKQYEQMDIEMVVTYLRTRKTK